MKGLCILHEADTTSASATGYCMDRIVGSTQVPSYNLSGSIASNLPQQQSVSEFEIPTYGMLSYDVAHAGETFVDPLLTMTLSWDFS